MAHLFLEDWEALGLPKAPRPSPSEFACPRCEKFYPLNGRVDTYLGIRHCSLCRESLILKNPEAEEQYQIEEYKRRRKEQALEKARQGYLRVRCGVCREERKRMYSNERSTCSTCQVLLSEV